jgi:hypothetical protein
LGTHCASGANAANPKQNKQQQQSVCFVNFSPLLVIVPMAKNGFGFVIEIQGGGSYFRLFLSWATPYLYLRLLTKSSYLLLKLRDN